MDRMPSFPAARSSTLDPAPRSPFRGAKGRGFRLRIFVLAGAIAAASVASPALATAETGTKVVRCGAQSCLLITGHRDDPAAVVSINGQVVATEGSRGWRVRIPVDTVRRWSAPYAREIEVSLHDPETQRETVASVDLPIGLLGNVTDLASLEVSVR